MRVALVGAPRLHALHGAEGTFTWGELRCLPEDEAALRAYRPDVAIALGAAAVPEGAWRRAAWLELPTDAPAGIPTLASGGSGLWRRAPLPAADALFAPSTASERGVLVVGGDETARDDAVAALVALEIPARASGEPGPEELAAAPVVAVLGAPRAPLPAIALAALARGRVVLAPAAAPAFGPVAGHDFLAHGHLDELTRLAQGATSWPGAFARLAALGRLAAEAQRASTVYGRIAADLLTAPPRSAAPPG